MRSKTAKEAKPLIIAVAKKAIRDGWVITSKIRIYRDFKYCCPLGALDIEGRSILFTEAAELKLGWSQSKINAFVIGYDVGNSKNYPLGKRYQSYYLLGKNMRKLFPPNSIKK